MAKKANLYNFILEYLENDNDNDDDNSILENFFKTKQIYSDYFEFKDFLLILIKISQNHHWDVTIDKRIKLVLSYFADNIKQIFTNFEIINIFKNCKKILLFLLQNQIAKIDDSSINIFINMIEKDHYYCHYFYPEIKSLNSQEIDLTEIENDISKIDEFDIKRKIGENETYICHLIRQDLVKEFIVYINRYNISLSSKIKQSIFETNQLLIEKEKVNLIEYAAFFGSIQIFRYLMQNNVKLTPSLWIYAIHSRNPELIHILEECNIKCKDEMFDDCYIESIKCHHNDFANYIQNALLKKPLCNDTEVGICMYYNNYSFKYTDLDQLFLCAAAFDNYNILKILIENRNIDNINLKVFNHIFVLFN